MSLHVLATPIGNLGDITLRALEVLKEVHLVAAEDTRVTRKLLGHYNIDVPIVSCHQHSSTNDLAKIEDALAEGLRVALVTDAGTPGISDPGAYLVSRVREQLPEVPIVSIPGPSAVIAALSISGLPADQFTFLGYPPHKKGRKTFFEKLSGYEARPVVFYESTHRLADAFKRLEEIFGSDGRVLIASELTKMHEELFDGPIEMAQEHFTGKQAKGEFVVILP